MTNLPNLHNLPSPSNKRLAVHLTPKGEHAIRRGHPWIFSDAIRQLKSVGRAGDVAIIFKRRRVFAVGLYDPDSPIQIKVLQHGRSATINGPFFAERVATALAKRSELDIAHTNGYRCINGENDRLPALIVDRYANTLVIKLYSAIWLPHLRHIVEALQTQLHPQQIILRLSRRLATIDPMLFDGQTLAGDPPTAPVLFLENGLTFEADVVKGQKTGHFLDQRDNRALVAARSADQHVLDVFASTGGFSLYAASGGARSVTSIDLSRPTLAAAERNFAHNQHLAAVRSCDHQFIVGDAFAELERLANEKRRFDMVILDPPSFAQKQRDVDSALNAYAKLTRQGLRVLKSGGTLVQASCSSRVSAAQFFETVEQAARRSGRPLRNQQHTGHAVDHPVTFPEGDYLKCIFANA